MSGIVPGTTPATDEHRGLWPALDAPGRYEIRCSCERWKLTGTASEIRTASRGHDDSPRNSHVMVIMHGGRRIDQPEAGQ